MEVGPLEKMPWSGDVVEMENPGGDALVWERCGGRNTCEGGGCAGVADEHFGLRWTLSSPGSESRSRLREKCRMESSVKGH